MKKIETFTIEERLSLDRLKHGRLAFPAEKHLHKPADALNDASKNGETGKEWIENLLQAENDTNSDFERALVKRGAERFSEWIEKQTGEKTRK